MNKGIKVLLIVLSVVFTLVLAVSSILFIFKVGILTRTSTKMIDEKEFDKIQDISINANIGDVYIEYSSNDKFKAEIYSDRAKEGSIVLNNENMIIELKEGNGFSLFRKTPKIVLYVPDEFANKIKINATTGDIKSEGFEKADFDINTTTGDVTLEKADNIVIKCTTGDVKIDEVLGKMNISTSTGDVKIDNIKIKEDSSISTSTGDVRLDEINDIYVNASTTTGDIKINDNNRRSDIELRIKTTTGDIIVG